MNVSRLIATSLEARQARLRLLAVTLWAGFLGAVPMLTMLLFALPPIWPDLLAMGALSKAFFLCWLLALLPALVTGLLLTHRPRGGSHGM